MSKIAKLLFLIILVSNQLSAQNEYPSYNPPLDIPLTLAANFGELRPNHFHMGLDFKTNGMEGLNLYAIEDGYVSRIKISTSGYGKVVYIDHPDGRTSVYAHCSQLKGELDSIVKKTQYAEESYEVEVFPKPNELKVKKGQIIALSGNTGGSTAPHLHFEIRDTKTEACLNPLVYGFDIADHKSPEIRKMKVFGLNKDGYQMPGLTKEQTVKQIESAFSIWNDTLTIPSNFCSPSGGIGFAFDIVDRLDGASNQCGLYGTYLIIDGDTIFGQRINQIGFEETRFVNTHRDMSAMSNKYHKAFRNIANLLKIYTTDNLGVININPLDVKSISIIAFDPKGNKSQLNFAIKVADGVPSKDYAPSKSTHVFPEDSLLQKGNSWSVSTSEGTVYEPEKIVQSSTAHFCSAGVEMQKATEIKMKLENPTLAVEKYYIAAGSHALETRYEKGWLIAESKYAGIYTIKTDFTAPTIRGISYNNSYIVTGNIVKLTIKETQTDLVSYDLFIDGKWHLMEYEYKQDLLFFERPKDLLGEHAIKIIAKDSCGNEVSYERTLNFK